MYLLLFDGEFGGGSMGIVSLVMGMPFGAIGGQVHNKIMGWIITN